MSISAIDYVHVSGDSVLILGDGKAWACGRNLGGQFGRGVRAIRRLTPITHGMSDERQELRSIFAGKAGLFVVNTSGDAYELGCVSNVRNRTRRERKVCSLVEALVINNNVVFLLQDGTVLRRDDRGPVEKVGLQGSAPDEVTRRIVRCAGGRVLAITNHGSLFTMNHIDRTMEFVCSDVHAAAASQAEVVAVLL